MTDEQINVAIAEACGWGCLAPDVWHNGIVGYSKDTYEIVRSRIPNYCADLNAMHEAEKMLGDQAIRREYTHILSRIVNGGIRFDAIHATARQRAEAFLRTIGRWEE